MQVSKLVSYPVHFAFKEYYFHDMAKPTLVYMYNSTTSNTKKFNIFVSWSFQYASEVTVDEILAQNIPIPMQILFFN